MPIFLFFFPVISVHKTSLNITIKVKTNLLHFGEGVCACMGEKRKMKTMEVERMATVEEAQKTHV